MSIRSQKNKKILFISSEFPPGPGGISNHAYNLAKQFTIFENNVHVITKKRREFPNINFDSNSELHITRYSSNLRLFSGIIFATIFFSHFLKNRYEYIIASGLFEIIFIDDGSTDSSREMLEELQHKYSKLRLIFHEKNKGYGGALQSGFKGATKDLIFYTDGDGQYDVFELRKLLRVMQEGVDVVNGYKLDRSDPLHRIVIGKVYLNLMRFLFHFKIRDVDCDFRLMRREIFDCISLHHTSGVICIELVKKME